VKFVSSDSRNSSPSLGLNRFKQLERLNRPFLKLPVFKLPVLNLRKRSLNLFGLLILVGLSSCQAPSSKAQANQDPKVSSIASASPASLEKAQATPETDSLARTADRPALTANTINLPNVPTPGLPLGLPIACTLGEDCFVMLYPDVDPGDGAIDAGCGDQTYNTHAGTDFAVANLQRLEEGVEVLAVADGTVLRSRDGVSDRRLRTPEEINAIAAQGIECGNGIVIDHGNGWEGQYCHLKQGSLTVKPGDRVSQGQVIGQVGVSGKTTFPHVDLTVRYNGTVINPFSGQPAAAGCQVEAQPIWQTTLAYEGTGIVELGFADRPPSIDDLWDGTFANPWIRTNAEVLLFWAHYYGVQAGDVERYRLIDGAGTVVTEYEQTIAADQRDGFSYVGKRNTPDRPIVAGTWTGEYTLLRAGKVIATQRQTLEVMP